MNLAVLIFIWAPFLTVGHCWDGTFSSVEHYNASHNRQALQDVKKLPRKVVIPVGDLSVVTESNLPGAHQKATTRRQIQTRFLNPPGILHPRKNTTQSYLTIAQNYSTKSNNNEEKPGLPGKIVDIRNITDQQKVTTRKQIQHRIPHHPGTLHPPKQGDAANHQTVTTRRQILHSIPNHPGTLHPPKQTTQGHLVVTQSYDTKPASDTPAFHRKSLGIHDIPDQQNQTRDPHGYKRKSELHGNKLSSKEDLITVTIVAPVITPDTQSRVITNVPTTIAETHSYNFTEGVKIPYRRRKITTEGHHEGFVRRSTSTAIYPKKIGTTKSQSTALGPKIVGVKPDTKISSDIERRTSLQSHQNSLQILSTSRVRFDVLRTTPIYASTWPEKQRHSNVTTLDSSTIAGNMEPFIRMVYSTNSSSDDPLLNDALLDKFVGTDEDQQSQMNKGQCKEKSGLSCEECISVSENCHYRYENRKCFFNTEVHENRQFDCSEKVFVDISYSKSIIALIVAFILSIVFFIGIVCISIHMISRKTAEMIIPRQLYKPSSIRSPSRSRHSGMSPTAVQQDQLSSPRKDLEMPSKIAPAEDSSTIQQESDKHTHNKLDFIH